MAPPRLVDPSVLPYRLQLHHVLTVMRRANPTFLHCRSAVCGLFHGVDFNRDDLCGSRTGTREYVFTCALRTFSGRDVRAETLAPYYDFQRGEGRRACRAASAARLARRGRPRNRRLHRLRLLRTGVSAGIDIRKGLQYQCISCGLCVDACNNIMDSVGFPKGLIRYDSEITSKARTRASRIWIG